MYFYALFAYKQKAHGCLISPISSVQSVSSYMSQPISQTYQKHLINVLNVLLNYLINHMENNKHNYMKL